MSINSSLVKLADKIDADNKSSVAPEYKNPNNSIEKSLERIADNYSSSGGGTGGGVLRINDVNETLDKTWREIYDAINSGKLCLIATNEYGSDILTVATSIATDNNTMYGVKVANNMYITNTENGYPAMRNA